MMTQQVKDKLRKLAAEKRDKNPTPASTNPLAWFPACDHANELSTFGDDGTEAYFRYLPGDVMAVLKEHLPCRQVTVRGYGGPNSPYQRVLTAFKAYQALAVLDFHGLNRSKYLKRIEAWRFRE